MMKGTHDPGLVSWVESANDAGTDFPIQNLPLGVFRTSDETRPRIGVAIGDDILDMDACVRASLVDGLDSDTRADLCAPALNAILARGRAASGAIRDVVSTLLRSDTDAGKRTRALARTVLRPATECTMLLPAQIGDYTDFYASEHHATNVGSMFRPDNPLLPNYRWIPIGYHGRSSSIVPSGTAIRRPRGQTRPDANAPPVFGASRSLDYELEVGAFIGSGNAQGDPVPLSNADDHLFGLCLVNDWSARDIQSWEYQPLGPFLAKNFATTISPWIVTLDALEPYRAQRMRAAGDHLLPHLDDARDRDAGAVDITLEVLLSSRAMRDARLAPVRLSMSRFREMYWTLGQMLAHHTSNGCNMRPGDLIASGTVSNASKDSRGCMLELTWRGAEPVTLPSGETRKFLEDGDEVVMRGWCERDGFRRIGFGDCRGTVTAQA